MSNFLKYKKLYTWVYFGGQTQMVVKPIVKLRKKLDQVQVVIAMVPARTGPHDARHWQRVPAIDEHLALEL